MVRPLSCLALALIAPATLFAQAELRFSNASYEVSEGSANAFITLFRTNDDNGSVSVTVTTTPGTASAGVDYTAISTTVNWPDNNDDSRVVEIPILNDDSAEPSETITLTLSNPTGGATLGLPSSATLTILDDGDTGQGAGEIAFSSPTYVLAEGETGVFTVTRTGGAAGIVSAAWTTIDGTATGGDDYFSDSGIVTFGNGDPGPKNLSISAREDDLLEGDETFLVRLSAPVGGATLGADQSTVIIADNEVVATGPCIEDDTTLCLGEGDRFRVQVSWRTNTATGSGQQYSLPLRDSGLFWFFREDNIEMLVKVLDACSLPDFNTFWVYFSATTDVGFDLIVTDTVAARTRVYTNSFGQAAAPVTDTGAFATCNF